MPKHFAFGTSDVGAPDMDDASLGDQIMGGDGSFGGGGDVAGGLAKLSKDLGGSNELRALPRANSKSRPDGTRQAWAMRF